ncbi:MAG: HesA/MoeB/ThiF family protein, partial [Desulfuromonas sp.]|nr:HesA/MoeB/ThiF family protein [Desulfuromonas sp.]
MDDICSYVESRVDDGLLSWSEQQAIAEKFDVSIAYMEAVALERGILPARYLRNQQMFSFRDQLCCSHVVVVGCGDFGGYIVEALARLGVGHLTVIDPDCFEEHDFNRQLLSSPAVLGCDKVAVAARRVAEINPAVTVTPVVKAFSKRNGVGLLAGAQIVVDGLGRIDVRLDLAAVCNEMDVPLVHGAIVDCYGHVATQMPGGRSLHTLYDKHRRQQGIENALGKPSFTPAMIASLEVAEVSKILLNQGESLRHGLLSIDLRDGYRHNNC